MNTLYPEYIFLYNSVIINTWFTSYTVGLNTGRFITVYVCAERWLHTLRGYVGYSGHSGYARITFFDAALQFK